MSEKRRQRLEWIVQVVRRNPGISVARLRGLVQKETGLKPATIITDLKALQAGGYLYERNFKIYPREVPDK